MLKECLWVLLIIIIILVALVIWTLLNHLGRKPKLINVTLGGVPPPEPEILGGAETIKNLGGMDSLAIRLLDLFKPYIKEVKDSKYLEKYLEDYYRLSASTIKTLKKDATNPEKNKNVEKSLRYLYQLIQEIIEDHDMSSVQDFIGKSAITYGSFVSAEKRGLLHEIVYAPVSRDLKPVEKILDEQLSIEVLQLQHFTFCHRRT